MDNRPSKPDQPYAWDDERLSAYLDGELSAPEQAQLEARLVVDPELRQLVDELRAVRQQLEILPEYRLQATFAEQVLRRAEQEMLLSPLGRESAETPIKAAVAGASVVSATAVVPAAAPLSQRFNSRRWRRGVIWTAVAAAAGLLLIVTNQTPEPLQNHVARHDLPQGVTVEHGTAHSGAAKELSPLAKPASTEPSADAVTDSALSGDSAQGFGTVLSMDKRQPEQNGITNNRREDFASGNIEKPSDEGQALRKQAVPGEKGSSVDSPVQNSPPAPSPVATVPQAAAAKQADAGLAAGNELLKNQAPAQFSAAPAKQKAKLGEVPATELLALLASKEFSQSAGSRNGEKIPAQPDEQVLVVYLTPRASKAGVRSFETLLTSNSIELADKSLANTQSKDRQRMLAMPATKPESAAAKQAAKTASDKRATPENKNQSAPDTRKVGDLEKARNDSAPRQEENTLPSSELPAQQENSEDHELYYLEADADQVDELLRQLRAAPDRFSRMSVASRGLPGYENRATFYDGKSLAHPLADTKSIGEADTALAGKEMSGKKALGNAQPDAPRSFAQGASPAPPRGADSAAAARPLSAPAAELALPFAERAPATPPSTELPSEPLPGGVPAAPVADANETIAAQSNAASSGLDMSQAAQASMEPTVTGQANKEQTGVAHSNRLGVTRDSSGQEESAERVIAYRLRGVDLLGLTKNAESTGVTLGANGSFGGGGGMAGERKSLDPEVRETDRETEKLKKADLNSPPVARPNQAGEAQNVDGLAQGQAPQNTDIIKPQQPESKATAQAITQLKENQPKSQPQPQTPPRVEPSTTPVPTPVPSEAMQRQFSRNKELEHMDPGSAEAAKQATPLPSKRLRVLFVIESEPNIP